MERATALGREANSASMVGRGSMAMPRIAVVSVVGAESGLKRAGREVCAENVPRSRKMAEGLSLESLNKGCCWAREQGTARREHVHAEKLEAFSWPVKVHRRAIAIGERHCAGEERVGRVDVRENGMKDAPVPRRKTHKWLMVSAFGSSNIAWVSSICWRLVCRRRPATQQPNLAEVGAGGAEGEGGGCGG